jgi:hypothetical protein
MNPKIRPEHLARGAAVYIRQSSMGQVMEHTESKRRQYSLAESAREMGFASVITIDDDLGRSGSGLVQRPGFQSSSRPYAVAPSAPYSASRRLAWPATAATGIT